MKLYFALGTDLDNDRTLLKNNIDKILGSFFYFKKGVKEKFLIDNQIINNKNFILDSGAFSAWNCNKPIVLEEYIEFIKKHDVKLYANLDDITNPDISIQNEKIMRLNGLNPISVFHMNESIDYLDKMIDNEYIALGGMVRAQGVEAWLDVVFNHIYKRNPNIKIHGFGLTKFDLILKYPFYSVDSSSWTQAAIYARISLWNSNNKTFSTISAREFLNSIGIEYNKGDKLTRELTDLIIDYQIKEFLQMESDINKHKLNKNYESITSQITLF